MKAVLVQEALVIFLPLDKTRQKRYRELSKRNSERLSFARFYLPSPIDTGSLFLKGLHRSRCASVVI